MQNSEVFEKIWALVEFETYHSEKPYGLIDLEEKEGKNSYYSPTLKKEFLEKLEEVLREKSLSVLNTRVIEKDG